MSAQARRVAGEMSGRIGTSSEAETMEAGGRLAAGLGAGDTVLLEGGLGVGKTVFVRGAARALGVDPNEVRSPTFTLVNIYPGRVTIYHVDLYRIEKEEELSELGLEEVIGTGGVAFVEWAEKLGRYRPREALWVRIRDRGGDRREISVEDRRGRDG